MIGVDGKPLSFDLERSNRPTRFYVKAAGIGRQEKEQKVTLKLAKTLTCIGGGVVRDPDPVDPDRASVGTLCRGRLGRRRLGAVLCLFLRVMSIYWGSRLRLA